MTNEHEIDFQKAAAASDMFQFLAMSMRLPEKQLAAGLLDGSIADDVTNILRELGFKPGNTRTIEDGFNKIRECGKNEQELFSLMRQEYTYFFTHPRKPAIPIYEALFCYKPGKGEARPVLFISPAALDAERCYKKAGLKMSKDVNDSGDHMATELEFMMYLYQQKAKAIRNNDEMELARRNDEISEFNRLHLKKWGVEFFEQCKVVSKSEVYHLIGETGSLFLTAITARM